MVTGFGLYGLSNPDGFFYTHLRVVVRSAWAACPVVRFIHHTLTWFFLIYIPVHVYFALRSDVTDREGIVSSIFSGGRWVRDDVEYEDA